MRLLILVWTWARRLPFWFTAAFLGLMAAYLVATSLAVQAGGVTTLADLLWKVLVVMGVPPFVDRLPIVKVGSEGLVVVFLLFFGVLVCYNLAAVIYQRLRAAPVVSVHEPAPSHPGDGHRLAGFERIGIILAGGGAKGAYQAGAMKAIYEFLETHNALDRVRMVAGTSIGSWNALFWLAGLIKSPKPGEPSAHEQWWRSISFGRIMEFDTYLPLRRNHFLLATPWREAFRRLFVEPSAVRDRFAELFSDAQGPDPRMHFYFTRSNVELGHLEFSTNSQAIRNRRRPNLRTGVAGDTEPVIPLDRYQVIEGDDVTQALARTEQAVFASMDLPPLFPYLRIGNGLAEWFEDGGVVENVPVWFGTQIEECDLLFVLPLNASFAEPVDHRHVAKRLFRVMDVRQGVIERNAFKMAYLYNELAALRTRLEDARAPALPVATGAAMRATRRQHKPVSVFAICPQQPLIIGTTEFWKAPEAGRAFDVMYHATRYELEEKFEEGTNPHWLRMTLVSPHGERTYRDDF